MRVRASLLMPLAATMVLGVGAGGASAATLYTSSSHSTVVAAGATASATATSPGIRLTSGSATVNNCAGSTLSLSLTSTADGTVVMTVNSGSFTTCNLHTTFTGAWTLNVTGGDVLSGTKSVFNGVTVNNIAADFAGGLLHGNITTGISASEASPTGAGLCVDMANAGTLTHPLTSAGKIDGRYCFTGTAANWSLG